MMRAAAASIKYAAPGVRDFRRAIVMARVALCHRRGFAYSRMRFPRRTVLAGLVACLAAWPLDAAEYRAGETYFGSNRYVEYLAGDLPLVIAAPHGGREKPAELPDREDGTFAFDTNTQELARTIAEVFRKETGHRPHVIICRVHRRKVDCNREVAEAAGGNEAAGRVWSEFQGFITAARATVVAQHGRGFFIDLHGHGHKDPRLELGYLHRRELFGLADAEINKPEVVAGGSLRSFARDSPLPYVELLRGPLSLGALLEKEGFPSTPSPAKPMPSDPYFTGGHNVQQHARFAPNFAGLQIETNFKGVRDTAESREKFARGLFHALQAYLDTHLGMKLTGRQAGAK